MLINGTAAMLKNLKTGRWHPIIFEEYPFHSETSLVRMKSCGHHTKGFDKREDAVNSFSDEQKKDFVRILMDEDIPWDGEGTPAMVGFLSNEKLVFL